MNEIEFPKCFKSAYDAVYDKPFEPFKTQDLKTDNKTEKIVSLTDINCDKKPCSNCPLYCERRECPPDFL